MKVRQSISYLVCILVILAGNDTFPMDAAAARKTERKSLIVAVINPTESAQLLNLQIRRASLSGKRALRRSAPQSLTATVGIGQEPGVKTDKQSLRVPPANRTFAPFSANIYEFAVNG
jgi:alpha-N-arabinofuranosidase